MTAPLTAQGLLDREATAVASDRFLSQQLSVELDHIRLLVRERPVLRQSVGAGGLAAGLNRCLQLIRAQPRQFGVDGGDGIQLTPGGVDGIRVELLQIRHRVIDGSDRRQAGRDREGNADPLKVSSPPAIGRVGGGLSHAAAGVAVSSCLRGAGTEPSPALVAGLSSRVGLLIALAVASAS
jgi:hypothetical protein